MQWKGKFALFRLGYYESLLLSFIKNEGEHEKAKKK